MTCYCNSGKTYSDCCEPLLEGKRNAATAEELMRSRYCAFVTANINYLLNTHHKETRPTKERKSILKWAKSVKWLRLEVISTKKGASLDVEGYVEFKAFYEDGGKMECIHENSHFVKENGIWFYKTGTHQ